MQLNSVYQLVDYRHGKIFVNPNDIYIGRSLIECGEYCQGEIDLFEQIVKADDIVFEVGANIGPHSIWLAKQVGNAGRLYVYEPQRLIFQMLCANFVVNGLANVVCINGGLGAQNATLKMQEPDPATPGNFGGFSLLGSEKTSSKLRSSEVNITTLDSYDVPSCKFIKIDVEGMECEVISGGKDFITKHKPVLYVENDRPSQALQLVNLISSLGYKMYWHASPLFNRDNFKQNQNNIFMRDGMEEWSCNMICIHQDDKRYFFENFTEVFPGNKYSPPRNFKLE